MKQFPISAAIFFIVSVTMAGLVSAQMTGGHSKMQLADSTKESGMMEIINNTSGHCQMMSQEFDKLQQHIDRMMKMDDMSKLKAEMKRHHEMMSSMHQKMSKQMNMCQNMMSMMPSGGMKNGMNMMGNSSDTAGGSSSHEH